MPAPGPGEAQVEVAAVGINFIDIYQREGVYPIPTPFVVGLEGAGTVEALGDGVDLAVGDRVAWADGPGSAAASWWTPPRLVRVPDGVDLEVAGAVMLQGITAHYLVNSTYAVQPGDLALVHAVAGGVGQLLVQLVKAKGATLIGTAGSAEKVALGLEAGRRPRHRLLRAVRPGRAAGRSRPDRRPGRPRRLRRGRQDDVRRVAGLAAASRDDGALRRRERSGPAVRHPAAQPRRLAVPHPADDGRLHRHPRGAARVAHVGDPRRRGRRVAEGRHRRPLPARRGGTGLRRPRRTPAPPASCCSSPDQEPASHPGAGTADCRHGALGPARRPRPVHRRRRGAPPPRARRAAGHRRRPGRPDRARRWCRRRRTRRGSSACGRACRCAPRCAVARRRWCCPSTSRRTTRHPRVVMDALRGGPRRGRRGARLGRGVRRGRRRRPRGGGAARSRPTCSPRPTCTARSASATPRCGPRSRPSSASRGAPSG